MTKLIVNTIKPQTSGRDNILFTDIISANGSNQWIDTYGIIKANKDTIDESVTIPSGTNGFTAGPITISIGKSVTVQGAWSIR
tara:strand:- start:390 stop:638 length:249 start_codon:yes stop_codon:yes gene_type:complete